MKYKKIDFESFSLHLIKTDRFKVTTMELIFCNEIKKEEITITNFLASAMCYTTKTYNLKIYSAFHELNAALYHVSQLKKEEIFTYDIDVYYFLANSMNSMLLISEEQIDVFTEEFYEELNKESE